MSKGPWKRKQQPVEPVANDPEASADPFADYINARRGPRDSYREQRRAKRAKVLAEMVKG